MQYGDDDVIIQSRDHDGHPAHQHHYCSPVVNPISYRMIAYGHTFSALRRLSRRLHDRSKNAIFKYPACILRPHLA